MKHFLSAFTTLRRSAAVLVLLALFVAGNYIPTAAAFTYNYFRATNDVLYYDDSDTSGACTNSSLVVENGDNVKAAYEYFMGKGLTSQQSAGIVGNLIQESGVDPASHQNGGGPGRGIAQWTVDERWVTLQNYARDEDRSGEIWTLGLQLDFLWHEFTTAYTSTYNALRAATTVRDATIIFEEGYERAGNPQMERRIAFANSVIEKYGTGDGTYSGSTSGCVNAGGAGSRIVNIARSELAKGVMEDPIGCDNANTSAPGDCGPEVNKYTDSHLEWWCADFISWVVREAGTPFTGGLSGGWRIPSVDNLRAWVAQNGTYFTNGASAAPQPGDFYFLAENRNGTLDYVHVGIVDRVEGETLYTISGNANVDNYNGVGVGAATFTNYKTTTRIAGFGRMP